MIPHQRYPRRRKLKEAAVGVQSARHLVDHVPSLVRDIGLRYLVAKMVPYIHQPPEMVGITLRRLTIKTNRVASIVAIGLHEVFYLTERTMTLVTPLLVEDTALRIAIRNLYATVTHNLGGCHIQRPRPLRSLLKTRIMIQLSNLVFKVTKRGKAR